MLLPCMHLVTTAMFRYSLRSMPPSLSPPCLVARYLHPQVLPTKSHRPLLIPRWIPPVARRLATAAPLLETGPASSRRTPLSANVLHIRSFHHLRVTFEAASQVARPAIPSQSCGFTTSRLSKSAALRSSECPAHILAGLLQAVRYVSCVF